MSAPQGCRFSHAPAPLKRMHVFASLTAACSSLPRRLGGRRARLLLLLLQPAGGERVPAPPALCSRWPGRQQHPPAISNMVRSGGSDGCLEIVLFPRCAAAVAEEGVWGLSVQYYSGMNSKASWTPCPSPERLSQRNSSRFIWQVRLLQPNDGMDLGDPASLLTS